MSAHLEGQAVTQFVEAPEYSAIDALLEKAPRLAEILRA